MHNIFSALYFMRTAADVIYDVLSFSFLYSVLKYLSSIKVFFNQILKLEYKVKVDVYSYMFMCDFFNFLVIIFGFASFGVKCQMHARHE